MITEAWEDKLNCRVCSGEITNQLEVCGCAMAAAAVESPIGTELQSKSKDEAESQDCVQTNGGLNKWTTWVNRMMDGWQQFE